MARVLLTNFHPKGGGGHVPYIQALTQMSGFGEHVVGVAAPISSRIYQYLSEGSYPYLYACDFPAKVQKEFPDILRSLNDFRAINTVFKPDIVHTNGAADLFIAVWSHVFSRPYKIIRTHHAIKKISNDVYHRWLYNGLAKNNIYVSRSAFNLSISSGLVPSNPAIIENGVDLDRFRPVPRNTILASEYGMDDQCFCFGSCAGTGHYKRIDTIIEAGLILKKEGKYNFRILVLGDESTGMALQRKAHEKGLHEFIYCGFQKDVVPYVSLFHAGFILSDSIETISFAAREMMAMGKPLISSTFSGLKENILDGINGFAVEPGNINETVFAMKRFMEMDKQTLDRFSMKAREFAAQNFDITNQKRLHGLLYDRMTKLSIASA